MAERSHRDEHLNDDDRMTFVSGSAVHMQSAPGRRPLPSTQRGRRTRAAIVDAAASLMYLNGVSATSLDDVLATAGAGKSGLYHYFVDKSDLVRAVIDRQLDIVLMKQPALNHTDSWAGIDAWMSEILDAHSAPGGPFACPLGTIAAELKNDEVFRPSLDAAFAKWEAPLARGLRRMQENGELEATADTARLASSMIAALQGGMLLARVRGDIRPLRDTLGAAVANLQRYATATRKPRAGTATPARRHTRARP